MAAGKKIKIEALRSLDFAAIGAAYVAVGTPTIHPARMILIQNFTDGDLMCSSDGITDHFPIKLYSAMGLDIATNKTSDDGFFVEKGSRLYVKNLDVPTAGKIYLTVFYCKQD